MGLSLRLFDKAARGVFSCLDFHLGFMIVCYCIFISTIVSCLEALEMGAERVG